MRFASVLTFLVAVTLCSSASHADVEVVTKGCQSKVAAIDFWTKYNSSAAASVERAGLASIPPQQVADQIANDLADMSQYYRIVEDIKDCPGGKFLAPKTK